MSFDTQHLRYRVECDVCKERAEWSYYHRKTKRTLNFCDTCVPPPCTPRYTKLKHIGTSIPSVILDAVPPVVRWKGVAGKALGLDLNGAGVSVRFQNDMVATIPAGYLEIPHPLEQLALAEDEHDLPSR